MTLKPSTATPLSPPANALSWHQRRWYMSYAAAYGTASALSGGLMLFSAYKLRPVAALVLFPVTMSMAAASYAYSAMASGGVDRLDQKTWFGHVVVDPAQFSWRFGNDDDGSNKLALSVTTAAAAAAPAEQK